MENGKVVASWDRSSLKKSETELTASFFKRFSSQDNSNACIIFEGLIADIDLCFRFFLSHFCILVSW